MSYRTTDLAKIHLAAKVLALTDESYRALLHRIAGVASAAELDIAGRAKVLAEFQRLGWKPTAPKRPLANGRKRSAPAGGEQGLALALWIDLHRLGEVRDASDLALAAYAKRMSGVDHWRWTWGAGVRRLVESLKAWHARAVLRALWHEGYAYGLVADPSDAALAQYLGRPSVGAIRASDAATHRRRGALQEPTRTGTLLQAVLAHRPTVPAPGDCAECA